MIELRWKVQEEFQTGKPVLQWRALGEQRFVVGDDGALRPGPSMDWQDVPIVAIPRTPEEPPACCGGGPQWGHAWGCPNAT